MIDNLRSAQMPSISGVLPVLPTPFAADGEIDLMSFDRVVDHLVGLGVPAVMVPGFASEFYKLDEAEKHLVGTRAIQRTEGSQTIVVCALHSHATRQAVQEARRWVDAGAAWVNLLPPHFMSPSLEALEAHCASVLEAVPETPVIVQLAPVAGGGITPEVIGSLARSHANLAAVKVEARPPHRLLATLRDTLPDLACFAGTGGLYLLDSLRLGAVGVQPGSGFVEVYQEIWRAFSAADHERAGEVFARLLMYLVGWANTQESMVALEKQIAHRRGLLDDPRCRLPHHRPHPVEVEAVDRFLLEFADLLPGVG